MRAAYPASRKEIDLSCNTGIGHGGYKECAALDCSVALWRLQQRSFYFLLGTVVLLRVESLSNSPILRHRKKRREKQKALRSMLLQKNDSIIVSFGKLGGYQDNVILFVVYAELLCRFLPICRVSLHERSYTSPQFPLQGL